MHAVLVGATDGIGRALAAEFLHRQWRVCILGRSPEKLMRVVEELRDDCERNLVRGVVWDAADPDRVVPAFEEALQAIGQLDLLVYCAGVMERGDTPDSRGRSARRMLEVNTAAAIHFLELGAEYLEAVGKGQLAAIGSVAGDRGRKESPAYGASKAGLHAYLEGLRHRLHGTGVTVSTIKPGWVRTRMLQKDVAAAIEPDVAARAIADGLESHREVFYVPAWWRLVGLGLMWTPRFLFRRIGPS